MIIKHIFKLIEVNVLKSESLYRYEKNKDAPNSDHK